MTSPSTMTAALMDTHAAPLKIVDLPLPVPDADQVLVKVRAAGLNPLDSKILAGQAAHARHAAPAILGLDMAGVIVDAPEGSGFRAGDEVYGLSGGVGGLQGSLGQYVAADARLLARKPANLSFRDAAALPLVVITAWEGLIDRAHVSAGQTVLVLGGAGGVGRAAVQIALAKGARVYAVDGAGKADDLRALGAIAIDRDTPVETYVAEHTGGRGFDIVYDTVGGAVLDAGFKAVRRNGHVVSCLGWGTHALAPLSFKAASYSGVFTLLPMLTGEGRAEHGEILRQAAVLVEAGQLKPLVDPRLFSLAEADKAFEAMTAGGVVGKLVVDL